MLLSPWVRKVDLSARLQHLGRSLGSLINPPRPRRRFYGGVAHPEVLECRVVLSTFVVTSTNDAGGGTLRQAILDANATPSAQPHTITFDFAANDTRHFYYRDDGLTGHVSTANVAHTTAADDTTISDIDPDFSQSWWSIQPTAVLPAITRAVIIDGYSQSGASRNTLAAGENAVLRVELNGQQVVLNNGSFSKLLTISAGNSTVQGLAINGFADNLGRGFGDNMAIHLTTNGGNRIQGNFIGTDVSGLTAPDGLPSYTVNFHSQSYGILITSSSNNWIGTNGDLLNDAAERNVIAATYYGVLLSAASNNVVAGNFIGTDSTGTRALGNWQGVGSLLGSTSNRIGSDGDGVADVAERNIISGNRTGVALASGGTSLAAVNSQVTGNFIGTDVTGTQPLGNLYAGVAIGIGAVGNQIGGSTAALANTIAYNGGQRDTGNENVRGAGVWVVNLRANPTGNRIQGNSIHSNHGLGIDLGGDYPINGPNGPTANDTLDGDAGPNNLQNFPIVNSAVSDASQTVVHFTLNSAANRTFTIDFYANTAKNSRGLWEGERYLESATVTTNGSGSGTGSITLPFSLPVGTYITATATDSNGNTSEFSGNFSGGNPYVSYQVVDASGSPKPKQAGSTIPIVVQLVDAPTATSPIIITAVGIASLATPDTLLPVASPGNSNPDLQFRQEGDKFQFNLKTPKTLAAGTYLFYFSIDGELTADGQPRLRSVLFVIK